MIKTKTPRNWGGGIRQVSPPMLTSRLSNIGRWRTNGWKDYSRSRKIHERVRRNKIYFLSRPEICFFKYVLFCQWIQLRIFSKHLLFQTNNNLPLCRLQLRKRLYRCNILWQNNDHRPFTRERIGLCSSVLLNRNEVIA